MPVYSGSGLWIAVSVREPCSTSVLVTYLYLGHVAVQLRIALGTRLRLATWVRGLYSGPCSRHLQCSRLPPG